VDGRLQTLLTPPQRLAEPMITRMKIMGDMDIATRRAPQDGHIALVYRGETCHYRVSTLPTVYGEKCVIRLLKKHENLTELDTLGLGDELLGKLRKAVRRPQGIVLVTGPTGSGKTTTLHAALHDINDPETNIVTLEDPVEASLSGINHVQINNKAGITFTTGLRSILRQDPDVIFVGEIRDPEVAQIAVKASLTGHLVMSTLHTNSAAESLMRLEDIGVPPYLLANALIVIIAQRLVRRVCKLCSEPYVPNEQEIVEFRLSPDRLAESNLVAGAGCEACYNTGYHGRQAIYEALFISNDLRALIRQGAPIEKVLEQAREAGFTFLFDAGIEAALRGITSLSEVRRTLSDAQ
jgi:type IV pilus assembly protein PilB